MVLKLIHYMCSKSKSLKENNVQNRLVIDCSVGEDNEIE